nr:hypothetical protein [Tanacetum cinerariifolium]
MLEENDYESRIIRIERYIKGKPHGKLIWKSIHNGPTPHPQTTDPALEGGAVPPPRNKRHEEDNRNELTDIQPINILSQWIPRRIFNILNQNETGREIWVNLELLMKGSGQTHEQRKEALFDEFERFRANGNELIHDYFVRFYKLVNDMKITQLDIPTHQLNNKFANNLLSYWERALKSLKKKEQSFAVVDPLAYLAKTTPTHSTTSPVTRRAPGNTGTKGIQTTGSGVNNSGKTVICYNCRGEGHVARQCKEPKPNHEDAYDSDVDEGPHASAAFIANLSSIGGTNGSSSSHINEVQISDDSFFGDVSYSLAQEMQQEEHLNSKVDSVLDDNMITYEEYQNDSGVEAVPTVLCADEADKQFMIAVLQRMHTKIAGYVKVNDEHKLVNATLTAELEWWAVHSTSAMNALASASSTAPFSLACINKALS